MTEQIDSGPAAPPKEQFIRRFGHATTVVNDKLFIEGGYVSKLQFSPNGTSKVWYYVDQTLAIPLDESWTNETVPWQTIDKQGAPNFLRTALWPKEDGFYMWGGMPETWKDDITADFYLLSKQLWEFTIDDGGGVWTRGAEPDPAVIHARPQEGSWTSGNGVGYYYGGVTSYLTTDSDDVQDNHPTGGLVSYNWNDDTWGNVTLPDDKSRIAGQTKFLEDFGTDGLVMTIGGSASAHGDSSTLTMDNVTIFDPATQKWYSQPTTGSIPSSREYFCTAGVKSAGGTYDIFVYGGGIIWASDSNSDQQLTYYDAHILSLPGFEWFDVPQAVPDPRADHRCELVGNRQVVVVGGFNWHNNDNTDFSVKDPNRQGLAVFDMSEMAWSSGYDANAPPYEVPETIRSWYDSADPNDVDWAPGVRELFHVTNDGFFPASSPSLSSSSSPSSDSSSQPVGAIAGGVVGGLGGLALVFGGLYFLRRRRRKQKARDGEYQPAATHDEKRMHHGDVPTASGAAGTGDGLWIKAELPGSPPLPHNQQYYGPDQKYQTPMNQGPAFEMPAQNVDRIELMASGAGQPGGPKDGGGRRLGPFELAT